MTKNSVGIYLKILKITLMHLRIMFLRAELVHQTVVEILHLSFDTPYLTQSFAVVAAHYKWALFCSGLSSIMTKQHVQWN